MQMCTDVLKVPAAFTFYPEMQDSRFLSNILYPSTKVHNITQKMAELNEMTIQEWVSA